MQIKTGIDIIKISRIQKSIARSGDKFLEKIFHKSETEGKSIQSLAGIYAAKEAVIKALDLTVDNWLDIKIDWSDTGKPQFSISNPEIAEVQFSISNSDLSISHDEEYAVASVVIILS